MMKVMAFVPLFRLWRPIMRQSVLARGIQFIQRPDESDLLSIIVGRSQV